MLHFTPEPDELETLKKAVAKYAHEPFKARLLSRLESPAPDFTHDSEEWTKLKTCIEQHLVHAQTEVRRDPGRKSAKVMLAKADALARKFHPNFS